MKNLILFDDDDYWRSLLPLTYTKPISELRVGILTLREKWELIYNATASFITQDYLAEKYPIAIEDDNVLINSSFLPTEHLQLIINDLTLNEAIIYDNQLVAARLDRKQFDKLVVDKEIDEIHGLDISGIEEAIRIINRPHHIFTMNGQEIKADYKRLIKGRKSQELADHNQAINKAQIFIEEGARVDFSILNAADGPIYIGKNATIMEGSIIKGPFAMGEHSVVKMGAKIYGDTTLGPFCKVGGEVQNVVFTGFSSKAHDGYLGNSVIGEWCNLGADTNSSNLKNNYTEVKAWSYPEERFLKTGLTFHGIIMGDHSKTGINTMLNTGTIIGINCNIFGSGYPRNFIPSYSWGGNSGFITYNLDKGLQTAEIVMKRRNKVLTVQDEKILKYVFFESAKYRNWE
jgi:UDP-N-acetylglucosamine diphosphorylase/glucosamine-1-phosphate N-acetyltransferase